MTDWIKVPLCVLLLGAFIGLTGCAAVKDIAMDAAAAAATSTQQSIADRSAACAADKGRPCPLWETLGHDSASL